MAELDRRNAQRRAALQVANRVKAERARLKQLVKEGKVDAISLIRGDDPEWERLVVGWEIRRVLRMVPGIGVTTEQEIYEVGKFAPRLKFSALSPARRDKLAELCDQAKKGWRRA